MEVDMLIDEIRRTPAKVLTEEQREAYWNNGYLLLERLIPEQWLQRLRAATAEMVERSRALTASDRVFDLEPDHTAAEPRLRRVTSPVDHHSDYWAYARESVLADVAADLVDRTSRSTTRSSTSSGRAGARRSSGTRTSSTGRTPTTRH
jgi:ectoine hydroxylase